MLVSTKGRYALRVMIDLAEHMNGRYIPMKEVAARQELSLKYMTKIMQSLTKGGVIEGMHGKGGGYRLTRLPEEYPVGEILRLAEGTLAPVSCLGKEASACAKTEECRTIAMWEELDRRIAAYLDSVTISDLMGRDAADQYVI